MCKYWISYKNIGFLYLAGIHVLQFYFYKPTFANLTWILLITFFLIIRKKYINLGILISVQSEVLSDTKQHKDLITMVKKPFN